MDSPDFVVRHRWAGPVRVVRVRGDLDADTVERTAPEVRAALDRARCVVLDLSSTTFLDCRAVGVLIALAAGARERGGRLRVAALPPCAHRLFSAFDLYPVLGGREDVPGECRAALDDLVGTPHSWVRTSA
ncbi:STAS domain-containing protein [Kineococcus sp. T13]|uniref:STAS domain-containing protein n=1 Tax=Kineococcus vitellinus TaxID=2696565 RepID=UPI00141211BE|nr:STAS domain-containing protein [Kineococcus vitellinus]